METKQLKQFEKAEINHMYQFLTNLDQNLLIIYSNYVSNFYGWVYDKEIVDKRGLMKVMEDLYSEVDEDFKSQLVVNRKKMYDIYQKYSLGNGKIQEEKTSFEATYCKREVPFILNKDDFEDIDRLKSSTQVFKMFEDENTAIVNYKTSFKNLCPGIEPYDSTFEKHGYKFMVDMNIWIMGKFTRVIDKIIEKIETNVLYEEYEVSDVLYDFSVDIYEGYLDLFESLVDGIYNDIASILIEKKFLAKS